jgi:rubrerythrin
LNLSEFKKIVAAWPDHEGDGAFDEDAQVWVETGRNRSSPVVSVTRLGQHDLYIATNAFTASAKCPECAGSGQIVSSGFVHMGHPKPEACPVCKGSGKT